ncbi:unnamed protein product, partial [Ixodes pacificus]
MPTSCVVFGCKRRARRGTGIGFFRFPAEGRDRSRRQAWIDAVGRPKVDGVPWEPSEASRVCGLHFVTGAPSLSPRRVDHVPTVFKDIHFGRRRRLLPKFDEHLGYNLVGFVTSYRFDVGTHARTLLVGTGRTLARPRKGRSATM